MNWVIYRTIDIVFGIAELLILARVFISWLPVSRDSRAVVLLYEVTEPILAPARNLILRSSFGRNMIFDFSPIIVFILLGILKRIIIAIL